MAENGKNCDQRRVAMNKEQYNGNFTDPSSMNEKKRRDREERQNIVLWRQPLITLQYFSLEILVILKEWTSKLWHRQSIVVSFLLLLAVLIATYYVEGAHQQVRGSAAFLFLYLVPPKQFQNGTIVGLIKFLPSTFLDLVLFFNFIS